MKKIITIIFFVFLSGFAQEQDRKSERIKNLKIAYISNNLDLTTQEAEKFWPIFNKFDDRKVELQAKKRMLMKKLKSDEVSSLAHKDNVKLLEESEKIEVDMMKNRQEFVKNLQGVISPQKILLLKKIEDDFKNLLLKQLERRKKIKELE
jgi:Skp family chaperone for outer membrane proteins